MNALFFKVATLSFFVAKTKLEIKISGFG